MTMGKYPYFCRDLCTNKAQNITQYAGQSNQKYLQTDFAGQLAIHP